MGTGRGRQRRDAIGQLELIAVPVQHGLVAERAQRRSLALRRQRDRGVADLLAPHRLDAGSHRSRDQLRSQADAQHRPLRGQPLTQELQLIDKEGVALVVLGSYRPTQNDQQIDLAQIDLPQFIYPEVVVVDTPALGLHQRCEQAEIFESQMPQGDQGLHGVTLCIVFNGRMVFKTHDSAVDDQ